MLLHPEDLQAIKELVKEVVKEEMANAEKKSSAKKGDKS